MGLLSRLSEWIASLTGGSDRGDPEAAPDDATEGGARDDAGDGDDGSPDDNGSTGLDPSAVAETRTTANDDAVDALREVRDSQAKGPEADADAESGVADGAGRVEDGSGTGDDADDADDLDDARDD